MVQKQGKTKTMLEIVDDIKVTSYQRTTIKINVYAPDAGKETSEPLKETENNGIASAGNETSEPLKETENNGIASPTSKFEDKKSNLNGKSLIQCNPSKYISILFDIFYCCIE